MMRTPVLALAGGLLLLGPALAKDTPHTDPAYRQALALASEADPGKSPGWARADLTLQQVCATKWGKDERAVTRAMKLAVYRSYGVPVPQVRDPQGRAKYAFPRYVVNGQSRPLYEVDHVWSRELDGADDPRNLALQSYVGDCNAHDKDRTENALHKDACAGKMTLAEARARLNHWIAEYQRRWGSCQHPEQN